MVGLNYRIRSIVQTGIDSISSFEVIIIPRWLWSLSVVKIQVILGLIVIVVLSLLIGHSNIDVKFQCGIVMLIDKCFQIYKTNVFIW